MTLLYIIASYGIQKSQNIYVYDLTLHGSEIMNYNVGEKRKIRTAE